MMRLIDIYYLRRSYLSLMRSINKINRLKPLSFRIKSKSGRSFGRIVSPRRSTYHRRIYRLIDYKRNQFPNHYSFVLNFTYDPNKFIHIALICHPIGYYSHILRPINLKIGDIITNLTNHPICIGDSSMLLDIPPGRPIHNISLYPASLGQITRSAGCSTFLIRKTLDQVLLKLRSGELRYFNASVTATLGVVSNQSRSLRNYELAGTKRRLGIRPRTRPSAMNPVDHSMGGRTRGGCQPKNPKGFINTHRPTVKTHHKNILYTKRQLKFNRY